MRYLHATTLILPLAITTLLVVGLVSHSLLPYLIAILIGLGQVVLVSVKELAVRNYSLDYIALLALLLSGATHEFLAGTVIALMYATSEGLEAYAARRARASLSSLLDRIPKTALVKQGEDVVETPLGEVTHGVHIMIRRGELVPLDGTLVSREAVLNLANLTGEPLPETLLHGALVKSGSVNEGEAIEIEVVGTLATSTYARIVDLVKDAERDQAPFVRFAAKANIPFTLITLLIAGGVYLVSHDLGRVLAVLVIATPCPLIIAAPIAFIGGLSRAAAKNIIVKTPVTLEAIASATTLFFDKTGTLTLGEPELVGISIVDQAMTETKALTLAAALEFHSIHPLARAVTVAAKEKGLTPVPATNVSETVGKGIEGDVAEAHIRIAQAPERQHRASHISLLLTRNGEPSAVFHFADRLKDHAKGLLFHLARERYKLAILTGDRAENAKEVFQNLRVVIHADCTPEEKFRLVDEGRAKGETILMIGDGLNDAPALARADVGVVFSGTENSASIEAADVAILGHDVRSIEELLVLSKRSVRIARQSVVAGIGLSTLGMLAASTGAIPPVSGAIIQEVIDALVILNALRSALPTRST